jgi:hypothetical protein
MRMPTRAAHRGDATSLLARRRKEPTGATLRQVVLRELAVVFLLLLTVTTTAPHRPIAQHDLPAQPWSYQADLPTLSGHGPLNAYAQHTLRLTAKAARGAIERQRDSARLDLLDRLVGSPATHAVTVWRSAHQTTLEITTIVAVLALVAYGLLSRPSGRGWLLALSLLLTSTLALTQPSTTLAAAQAPARGAQAVASWMAVELRLARPGTPAGVQETLAGRYWTAFVDRPLSRMQTGTPALAEATPTDEPGLLALLRRHLSGMRAWALGQHAPERAVIATLALAYALPTALVLLLLAMVAVCAKSLSLLLCLAALVAAPLTATPRWRGGLLRWWLAPLGVSLALVTGASLASLGMLWTASALHAVDETLSVLLAEALIPLLAVGVFAARLWNRVHASGASRGEVRP